MESTLKSKILSLALWVLLGLHWGCGARSGIISGGEMDAMPQAGGDLFVEFDEYPVGESTTNFHVNILAPVTSSSVIFCNRQDANCSEESVDGQGTTLLKRVGESLIFRSQYPVDLSSDQSFLFLAFSGVGAKAFAAKTVDMYARGSSESGETINDPQQDQLTPSTIPQSLPSATENQNASDNIGSILSGLLADMYGPGGGATTPSQPVGGGTPSQPNITPTTLSDSQLVPNPNNVPLSASEFGVIKFTNEERVRQGKTPLIVQQSIMVSSRESSRIMEQRRSMQHGFTSGWRAENIAMGQRSAEQVVRTWINSPGHYRNMMGNHTYIGVGDTSQNGSYYWTQQFN